MPYDAESKRRAQRFATLVRALTVCARCGKQPIEFHNDEHKDDSNRRVAHLAALGFPLDRIKREIRECEPLCRRCHMLGDGRLAALIENRPRKKGMVIVPPTPCVACGELAKPTRRGMCRRCYDAARRA
jgi:hypothetical protein